MLAIRTRTTLDTGVHGQDLIVAKVLGDVLGVHGHNVVVERSRSQRELGTLLLHHLHQPRVAVTLYENHHLEKESAIMCIHILAKVDSILFALWSSWP